MRREWILTLAFLPMAVKSPGQQIASQASSGDQSARPDARLAYFAGPDLAQPELIPSIPLPVFTGKCKRLDGSVEFALVVDPSGQPRQITFSHMLDTDLDRMALQIVLADRFKPGILRGEPVAAVVSLKVNLQGCLTEGKDNSGRESDLDHLRAQPVQEIAAIQRPAGGPGAAPYLTASPDPGHGVYRVDGGVTAPVPLNSVAAAYTEEAARNKINGACILQLIVDSYGLPQNLKVVRSLDNGLDQNAIKAVRQYRFKPAMKGDRPVPVTITVAVNFRAY